MDIKKIDADITCIDKDNNRVISKDFIAKIDIGDGCSYTDIIFTLFIKNTDINDSCKDLLKYMINCKKSTYVLKDLITSISKYTMKSERTFIRCISDLKKYGLIRQSKDIVYIPNDIFNKINEYIKFLIIEINPETNKINL